MQGDKLRAKVDAVNIANEYAMKLKTHLDEIFRPLVEKKIYKADGNMLEKYKGIENFPHDSRVKVSRRYSDYFLGWNVSVMSQFGDSVAYHDVCVYVGKIEGQILTELYPAENFRHDYTFEEVSEKKKYIEELEEKVRNAKSEMRNFY